MHILKIALIFLISGLVLSAYCFEGAKNTWVSNSQWVNTKTQRTFAQSAARIEGATLDQDAAIAIFNWAMRCYGHIGGGVEGPKGAEVDVLDPWNAMHIYTANWCDPWNRLLCELWMGYKNNYSSNSAKKVNTDNNSHAQAGLGWSDPSDHVFRYHLFDGLLGFYTYTRSGTIIASPESLVANFSLVTNPSVPHTPYFIRRETSDLNSAKGTADWTYLTGSSNGNSYAFVNYNNSIPISKYSTNFDLRKGETLKRQWFNDAKPVMSAGQVQYAADIQKDNTNYYFTDNMEPKDPKNQTIQSVYFDQDRRVFGNGYLNYTPELTNSKFSEGAISSTGLVSGDPASGEPALHAAATGATGGNVIYQMYSIYNFSESFIVGSYLIKSAGSVKIDFSVDSGATWTNVLNASTVSASAQNFNIDIGKGRWDAGQTTTYNMCSHIPSTSSNPGYFDTWFGYRYRVRITISATNNAADVGLVSLSMNNTVMLNMFMLPTLVPGQNNITVDGTEITAGCLLAVKYVWEESGTERNNLTYIGTIPTTYTIQVNEQDTANVKCKYIEMKVVDVSEVGLAPHEQWGSVFSPYGSVSPNPFTGAAMVSFRFPTNIAAGSQVSAVIFDIQGKKLANYCLSPSSSSFVWNGMDAAGKSISPGVYFVNILKGKKQLKLRLVKM